MNEFYEEDLTPKEHAEALQRRINDGSIWKFEGAAGRAAMGAIEAGQCAVGQHPSYDYWGNMIPAREMLKPGTKGTIEYVREHMGDDWAEMIEKVEPITVRG